MKRYNFFSPRRSRSRAKNFAEKPPSFPPELTETVKGSLLPSPSPAVAFRSLDTRPRFFLLFLWKAGFFFRSLKVFPFRLLLLLLFPQHSSRGEFSFLLLLLLPSPLIFFLPARFPFGPFGAPFPLTPQLLRLLGSRDDEKMMLFPVAAEAACGVREKERRNGPFIDPPSRTLRSPHSCCFPIAPFVPWDRLLRVAHQHQGNSG